MFVNLQDLLFGQDYKEVWNFDGIERVSGTISRSSHKLTRSLEELN